jgi:hypothetical protein
LFLLLLLLLLPLLLLLLLGPRFDATAASGAGLLAALRLRWPEPLVGADAAPSNCLCSC